MIESWLAFLAGLVIGSFLNVCIYRLPRDLSVVRPRSHCPACGKTIAWYDNLPVASYLLLKGRCRHCGGRISPRYPVVELLTAALFFTAFATLGPGLAAVKLCVLAALLVALIFTDLVDEDEEARRILPDELTLGGTLAGLVFAWLVPLDSGLLYMILAGTWPKPWASVAEAAFAAAFGAGMLWLLSVVYMKARGREGMGLGDVKMIAMLGAFFGLHGALATLVVGSLLGSVVGLAYIKLAGKDAQSYELPFGSFLGLGGLLVAFAGDELLDWWGRLMSGTPGV